jgi:alpha-amylase
VPAVTRLGYDTIITEGVDALMTDAQGANRPYLATDGQTPLLLRNHSLSDDIAFRLSDPDWDEYPLTAKKYASWLHGLAGEGAKCLNLFMDYETFGEHRRKETGIFEFLEGLPTETLLHRNLDFATPSEISRKARVEADVTSGHASMVLQDEAAEVFDSSLATYDVPEPISWADASRSLAAWTADNMQQDALKKVYALETLVTRAADARITEVWGRLQISDHFYYMSTRFWSDPVHRGFSPYRSPYDAYINYMNVLSDFEMLIR